MTQPIRTVLFGVGAIGAGIGRLAAQHSVILSRAGRGPHGGRRAKDLTSPHTRWRLPLEPTLSPWEHRA